MTAIADPSGAPENLSKMGAVIIENRENIMTSMYRYQLPVKETGWQVDSQNDVRFAWEYEDGNDALLKLYDKGKQQQWDAKTRIN
jgi:hypothetical protein